MYQKAVQKAVSGSLGVNMNGSGQGLNNYCYCSNDHTVMTVWSNVCLAISLLGSVCVKCLFSAVVIDL